MLTLSLILLSPTPLWAQNVFFNFTNIALKQGLGNTAVMKVLQDHQGFIWVATQDGLFRYDGYDFKPFKHDPEDPA